MGRNEQLRRSRSWKDLSIFTSKKAFHNDDQHSTATTPRNLKRTSSLGRGKLTKSRMYHDFDIDNLPKSVPTPSEQRTKELAFQQRASTIKRKLVPTPPPPPAPPKHPAHLPGFAFTPQVLHTPPQHTKNRSVSGHSRMASEMSVPMILDFDLERHQDNVGLDFGFNESMVQRDLSEEEKADLVHNAQPMHVVNLQRLGSKSSRTGTLKRIFSLRRNEKSHSRQSSTSKTKNTSPKGPDSRSLQQTLQNFEGSNSRTIYARPPQIHQRPLSPPPSPTSSSSAARRHRGDAPPRLTVQIPNSTMDRASKIFQSIYAAHAQAQHELGSQFGLDTPQSASPSPPRQVLPIPPKTSIDISPKTFNATPRPAPRPRVATGLLPAAQISKTRVQSIASTASTGLESVTMTSQATSTANDKRPQSTHTRLIKRGSRGRVESPEVRLSKRYSRIVVTAKGKMLTFPSPPEEKRKSRVSGGFMEFDTEEEDFESDEEWDVETIDSYTGKWGVSIKEPAWEMLTPPTRVAAS